MIRGTGSLSHGDEHPKSPATSKVLKKKPRTSTNSKNPYSETGLDKFSSVLADLRARKETILATGGTQGVSIVQFKYKNSQDWVPIIVRTRDQQQQQEKEKEKPSTSISTNTNSKNPYSARGLDKFSSVLADLRARKEKILTRAGAHGISMIQFMYKNSQDWVPIIVKTQEEKSKKAVAIQPRTGVAKESPPAGSAGEPVVDETANQFRSLLRWRPSYYRHGVAVLILLCLLLLGRVLAISGTCIWFGATWCPR